MACDANNLHIKIYVMGDACRSYLYINGSLYLAATFSKVSLYQVFKNVFYVHLLPNDPYVYIHIGS